jgi:hypothetical protein
MASLPDRVFQDLINKAIVRDPRVAGALPPAFRDPADGVPAPGEGAGTEIGPTAVVGIQSGVGIPAPFMEEQWRSDTIDITIRTLKSPDAKVLYAKIREALIGPPFRMGGTLAGMRIIQAREWNGLALLDSSRAQGFMYRFSVYYETYSEDHFS